MKSNKMTISVVVALFLSIICGLLLQNHIDLTEKISVLGTIYVNLIKMIMLPLVFTSLVLGVSSMDNLKKLGKIGVSTIAIFMTTTAVAVVIGLCLSLVFQPGTGIALISESYEVSEFPNIIDTIIGIVPSNPFASFVNGNMLQIIFFSIVLGIGIVIAGDKGEPLRNIVDSVFEIMSIITKGVMYLTPAGIVGLMVPAVANNGAKVLLPLLKLILVFYLATIMHICIVYFGILKAGCKMSVKKFLSAMFQAQIVAFTTCSSAAALPVSLKCIQENLKVSKEVSSFVLPLGSTVNMDGNALYQGIVALFIAQAYGVDLTATSMLMVILTGTLASIGASGVPGAGMIVLSMVLLSVGLPVDGIALVAGIDRILDMGRTLINVTGDAATACMVERIVNKNV